jgi:hypothetical protein
MQPLTILALLASSAFAFYTPGTTCKDNIDCNNNCEGGQWTIAANSGGSYQFICVPAIPDESGPKQYYSSVCGKYISVGPLIGSGEILLQDEAATASACKSVGGVFCRSCVSSGVISKERSFRESWYELCKAKVLVNVGTDVQSYDSETEAKKVAQCG